MNNNPFDIRTISQRVLQQEMELLRTRLKVHVRRQQINEKLISEFRAQCEKLPEGHELRVAVEQVLDMFDQVVSGKLDAKQPPPKKAH